MNTDAGSQHRLMAAAATERLARHYAADGLTHPRAAAIAITVRGLSGLDARAFADAGRIEPALLDAAEGGELAVEQLPQPIRRQAVELGLIASD